MANIALPACHQNAPLPAHYLLVAADNVKNATLAPRTRVTLARGARNACLAWPPTRYGPYCLLFLIPLDILRLSLPICLPLIRPELARGMGNIDSLSDVANKPSINCSLYL